MHVIELQKERKERMEQKNIWENVKLIFKFKLIYLIKKLIEKQKLQSTDLKRLKKGERSRINRKKNKKWIHHS